MEQTKKTEQTAKIEATGKTEKFEKMKKEDSVGYQMRMFNLVMMKYLEHSQEKVGLDHVKGPQAWALFYLVNNHNKEIFQIDLETEMGIRKSTASKLVERLVNNGYLTTQPAKSDGRKKQLLVTEKAIQHNSLVKTIFHESEMALRQDVSKEDITQFLTTVKKFNVNLAERLDA